jgi:hypothetical protein
MLHQITKPIGHEVNIQQLQTKLYNALSTTWDIGETNFEFYGLTRKLSKGDEVFPGWWDVRTNKDYKAITFDDKKKVVAFFGMDDEVEHTTSISTANVHVIFFIDLHNIYENSQRRDIEARKAVYDLIFYSNPYGFRITRESYGTENALREYTKLSKDLTRYDVHPLHVFRFDLELKFKTYKP